MAISLSRFSSSLCVKIERETVFIATAFLVDYMHSQFVVNHTPVPASITDTSMYYAHAVKAFVDGSEATFTDFSGEDVRISFLILNSPDLCQGKLGLTRAR